MACISPDTLRSTTTGQFPHVKRRTRRATWYRAWGSLVLVCQPATCIDGLPKKLNSSA